MRPVNPGTDLAQFAALEGDDKLKHLLKFGLLAPSSHNTQPWLFKLSTGNIGGGNGGVGTKTIEVQKNQNRALIISDPTEREMYLSLGTAVQNILFAAEYFGYSAEAHLFAEGEVVAHIELQEASQKPEQKDVINAVIARHNNRFPYESKIPEQNFVDWLQILAAKSLSESGLEINIVTDAAQRDQIVNTVGSALEHAMDDNGFRQELSNWIKPSLDKYSDGMPGYNLAMPAPMSFIFPTMLRNMKLGKMQRGMDEKVLQATPAFVIISAANDNKESWLKAGMLFENIAVHAQLEGLKVGVQAAAIEIKEFYKDLQNIVGTNGRPVMFFRLGYTDKVPKLSPRLSLEEVLIK